MADLDGYIAFLQLADLQWMYFWQNDLLGCIFGEITAIADEFTVNTSKNNPIIDNSTSKIAKFTSILLRNDKNTPYTFFVQIFLF